jgi:hypothetical protein
MGVFNLASEAARSAGREAYLFDAALADRLETFDPGAGAGH